MSAFADAQVQHKGQAPSQPPRSKDIHSIKQDHAKKEKNQPFSEKKVAKKLTGTKIKTDSNNKLKNESYIVGKQYNILYTTIPLYL